VDETPVHIVTNLLKIARMKAFSMRTRARLAFMPRYRIHRLKEGPREHFRWAAHTGGLAVVKMKDYEDAGEVEAATPYAAWKILEGENRALERGDVLESATAEGTPGELTILKYIGFEPAKWYVPEPKLDTGTAATDNPDSVVLETHSQPL
jgi:hypothetical protein